MNKPTDVLPAFQALLAACVLLIPLSTQSADPATKAYVGKWTNKDFNSRGITRLTLRAKGDKIGVHIWGRCHPTECDWGDNVGTLQGDSIVVHDDAGFAIHELKIKLLRDGTLEVSTHTHFTDNSGRKDYDSVERFKKGLKHDWTDPKP